MIVDFKSMYPSIMLSAYISHDNVVIEREGVFDSYSVERSHQGVVVTLPDCMVRFPRNPRTVSYTALRSLISYRSSLGKDDPVASASIKAATNSLFGALGYSRSPIYSPRASMAVTAIGRWLLDKARCAFEGHGMVVLYGDTDSLFVKSASPRSNCTGLEEEVNSILETFHEDLGKMGFSEIQLRIEPSGSPSGKSYSGAVIIDKKMCILLTPEGGIKARGVSIRRKDRPSIVNDTYERCAKVVAKYGVGEVSALIIHKSLVEAVKKISTYSCKLSDVAIKKRVAGNPSYVYKGGDGSSVTTEESSGASERHVRYDRTHILDSLVRTLDPFLSSCGMGRTRDVLGRFVVL